MRIILGVILGIIWRANLLIAQSYCPPNIDFENGNYGYWVFKTGTCCPISTPTTGRVNGRHTLTNGTAVDPYGGFPIVAPNGNLYSLKLGNSSTGSQSESATYYVQVPTGVTNYSLLYRYAVVFQDPAHTASQQPRFEVSAVDSATNLPLNCNNFSYIATSNLPGFQLSSTGTQIYYRGWTVSSLDLSGYQGQTVKVTFATGDCSLGGHFGYGYIDLNCSLFQISNVICANVPYQYLNGPPGFQTYEWYDDNYTNLLATGQNIILPTPTSSTTIHLILTPYPGYGCTDTLHSSFTIKTPFIIEKYDSVCYPNTSYPPHWDTSGRYYDTTYIPNANCDSVRYVNLYLRPKSYSTYTETICQGDSFLGYKATGTYHDTFWGQNIHGCDSIRELNLTVITNAGATRFDTICRGDSLFHKKDSGQYNIVLKNIFNCDSIVVLNLYVRPRDSIIVYDSICNHSDSVMIGGRYYKNPGYYMDTLQGTDDGCDSIVGHHLSYYPNWYTIRYDSICYRNDSFLINGIYIKVPGIYKDTARDQHGCDSFIEYRLSYYPKNLLTIRYDSICRGDSILIHGVYEKKPGTYLDTILDVKHGCDSFLEYRLSYYPNIYTLRFDSICNRDDSILIHGIYEKFPGIYYDTLPDRHGCDSFIEMRLAYYKNDTTTSLDTLCYGSSRFFNGVWIDSTGLYLDTFKDIKHGCDSFIHLYLYVYPPAEVEKLYYEDCQSVTFRNITYTQSDSVKDVYKFQTTKGCDSLIRKHYIQIWPAPITKPQVKINYCDTIVILGKKHSDTFFHIDTIRKNHSLACDSIYQPIIYQKQITPKGQIQIDPKRDRYFIGDRVTLTPPRARHHLWNSLDTGRFVKYIIYRDTSNYVISWNAIECQDTTYIRLYTTDTAYYRVPRAFTPNGDGINDILYARGDGMEKLVKFEIYNRLGQLLFRTTNIKEGWDGNYKNIAQVSDPYFFIIEAIDYKGKKFVDEGNFLLLR